MLTRYVLHPDYTLSDRKHSAAQTLLDGPTPCDGCELWQRCAQELLACRAFARFANLPAHTCWTSGGRQGLPTRQLYDAVFSDKPMRGRAAVLPARERILAQRQHFDRIVDLAMAVDCSIVTLYQNIKKHDDVRAHVNTLLA